MSSEAIKKGSTTLALNAPRKIKSAALHEALFWPGSKCNSEKSLNNVKFPKLKMVWVPGVELNLEMDGECCTIPASTVSSMVNE